MSGRRGNCRYGVTNAEATVRVLREVTVQNGAGDEFVAISGEPAAAGDVFILDRIVDHAKVSSRVSVIDSRPAVVNGSVRYRLRLKPLDEAGTDTQRLRSSRTAQSRTR
jgi:hypothetical protein